MARIHAPLVKILVAGASQVGKTSLVHKYVFNDFIDICPLLELTSLRKSFMGKRAH
ncbi:MAG: hypothetical protein ACFE8O_05260 [Candidatus Hermodarchaeota archaeon]